MPHAEREGECKARLCPRELHRAKCVCHSYMPGCLGTIAVGEGYTVHFYMLPFPQPFRVLEILRQERLASGMDKARNG